MENEKEITFNNAISDIVSNIGFLTPTMAGILLASSPAILLLAQAGFDWKNSIDYRSLSKRTNELEELLKQFQFDDTNAYYAHKNYIIKEINETVLLDARLQGPLGAYLTNPENQNKYIYNEVVNFLIKTPTYELNKLLNYSPELHYLYKYNDKEESVDKFLSIPKKKYTLLGEICNNNLGSAFEIELLDKSLRLISTPKYDANREQQFIQKISKLKKYIQDVQYYGLTSLGVQIFNFSISYTGKAYRSMDDVPWGKIDLFLKYFRLLETNFIDQTVETYSNLTNPRIDNMFHTIDEKYYLCTDPNIKRSTETFYIKSDIVKEDTRKERITYFEFESSFRSELKKFYTIKITNNRVELV